MPVTGMVVGFLIWSHHYHNLSCPRPEVVHSLHSLSLVQFPILEPVISSPALPLPALPSPALPLDVPR